MFPCLCGSRAASEARGRDGEFGAGRGEPPLARALHATVEIDREVPAEHYQAVAEVIGYVMKLNRAAGAARR